MNDHVAERLEELVAIMRIAFAEQISAASAQVRGDHVAAAVLDAVDDWVPVGLVKKSVADSVGTSEKTVQRRIAELTSEGFIKAEGNGASRRIKSTGII